MKITCTLRFEYNNKQQAQHIHSSTTVDDEGHLETSVQDKTLTACIHSTSLLSLMHTLDDYLACISVAENIVKKK